MLEPGFIFAALGALLSLVLSIALIRAVFRTAAATEGAWAEAVKQTELMQKQNDSLTQIAVKLSAGAR